MCLPKGSAIFSTFDEAKEACSMNPQCKMFYNEFGKGKQYILCCGNVHVVPTKYGSVLYEKKLGK
jgi:hypothetical protein